MEISTRGSRQTNARFIDRSVYRIVELWDGWTSKVLHTELYFSECLLYPSFSRFNGDTEMLLDIFDAAMIFLAFFTFNVFHPGRLLAQPVNSKDEEGTKLNDLNVNERGPGA